MSALEHKATILKHLEIWKAIWKLYEATNGSRSGLVDSVGMLTAQCVSLSHNTKLWGRQDPRVRTCYVNKTAWIRLSRALWAACIRTNRVELLSLILFCQALLWRLIWFDMVWYVWSAHNVWRWGEHHHLGAILILQPQINLISRYLEIQYTLWWTNIAIENGHL